MNFCLFYFYISTVDGAEQGRCVVCKNSKGLDLWGKRVEDKNGSKQEGRKRKKELPGEKRRGFFFEG